MNVILCWFTYAFRIRAWVVHKLDCAIHRINHYPADKFWGTNCVIHWIEIIHGIALSTFSTTEACTLYTRSTLCPPRACLHGGGEPQIGEVTCGGHPTYHVNVINLIKMRDYMNRGVTPPKRVTSPPWGHPLPRKQALTPSDFFLTPGGKNSATTINISQVN